MAASVGVTAWSRTGRRYLDLGLAWLIVLAVSPCVPCPAAAIEGEQRVLAEGAFRDPADPSQVYQDTPYVWLERYEIRLEIRPVPAEGVILRLKAGCKGDQRTALLEINGQPSAVSYTGPPGFVDFDARLPGGVETYDIRIKPIGERAAFFAGYRVLAAGDQPILDDKLPQVRVTLSSRQSPKSGRGGLADAYPEMKALWTTPLPEPNDADPQEAAFRLARKNGLRVNEQFFRCSAYLHGWLEQADPATGLIPRNLRESRDYWNAEDSAADNYPFMVLTAYLTDPAVFDGPMKAILETESRLTARLGRLPDAWSFSRRAFLRPEADVGRIIFGASEYAKDGLLPLTEYLGPSPWADRLLELENGVWEAAATATPNGPIPSDNVEVNGEQLQVLSRLYWMTGDERYLDYAVRLGDYYLLGNHHPTRDFDRLHLRDHGCEILSGLCELYAATAFARPDKKAQYQAPIREMCDRVLAVGRDERGMLYNFIDPKTGEHDPGICDTWGYNYNGIYTVALIDDVPEYREAVRFTLRRLPELKDYDWGGVADEYADSIEGALNLYNREPVEEAAAWIDGEIGDMWQGQGPDGIIEGWHGDGNVARTAVMYAFWKTQGLRVAPWRPDLCLGTVRLGETYYVSLWAKEDWQGKLIFDRPRHRLYFHLPLDYPRINQFPEWLTVGPEESVEIREASGGSSILTGPQSWEGYAVRVPAGQEVRLIVTKHAAQ
ncbi:hypothetical protein [Thermopirellula anaerolimosa]